MTCLRSEIESWLHLLATSEDDPHQDNSREIAEMMRLIQSDNHRQQAIGYVMQSMLLAAREK